MSTERTFSIIKPDAVERNKIGEITGMLESAGLRVVASKRLKLDQAKASQFYEVHKERPFFQSLCDFCLLYTSPSPRDKRQSRMPSSA